MSSSLDSTRRSIDLFVVLPGRSQTSNARVRMPPSRGVPGRESNVLLSTQLWRYAISGCDQNREFKVWSCTNWSCLQVIRFEYSLVDSAFHPVTPFPVLQASIDLTSRFLVLSDIHRNVRSESYPTGEDLFFSSRSVLLRVDHLSRCREQSRSFLVDRCLSHDKFTLVEFRHHCC